jgi:hypothetical protein
LWWLLENWGIVCPGDEMHGDPTRDIKPMAGTALLMGPILLGNWKLRDGMQ